MKLWFVLVILQVVLSLGTDDVVLPLATVSTFESESSLGKPRLEGVETRSSASVVTAAVSLTIPSSGNSVTVEWVVQVAGAPLVLWQFCSGNDWLCEAETKDVSPFLYQICLANGNVTVGDLPTGTSAELNIVVSGSVFASASLQMGVNNFKATPFCSSSSSFALDSLISVVATVTGGNGAGTTFAFTPGSRTAPGFVCDVRSGS
jgi:hypothetical protein